MDEWLARIGRRFTALETRIVEDGQTTRRYISMVPEDLKREIRNIAEIIAEGQRALNENRSEHKTFSAALSKDELRLMALEYRRRRKTQASNPST